MKILFVIPPRLSKKSIIFSTQIPIGLGFLISYINSIGHESKLIDYEVEEYSEKKFVKLIKDFCPDIIGFSCMTPQIKMASKIADFVKQNFKNIVTMVGGKHISALPENTMKSFVGFDIGVVGEGEYTLRDFLDCLKGNKDYSLVKGIVWKNNEGKIIINPERELISNLDDIPYPDRSMFNLSLYKGGMSFKGKWRTDKFTEILTTRGCPNQCIFCSSQIVTKRKVRSRSIENIIMELDECKNKFGFTHFRIVDDTFTLNRKLVIGLCEWFKKNNVTWNCNARVDTVDLELLEIMKDSGCIGIMFGVESGSPELLKKLKKGVTLEKIINTFKWAHKSKIPIIEADFIVGSHPSENMEDINQTIALIKKLKPNYLSVAVLIPYPGTEVRSIMIKENLIEDWALEDWDNYKYLSDYSGWRTKQFSQKELKLIQKKIMRNFYLSFNFIFYYLKSLMNFKEFVYSVKGFFSFLRIMKK